MAEFPVKRELDSARAGGSGLSGGGSARLRAACREFGEVGFVRVVRYNPGLLGGEYRREVALLSVLEGPGT